MFFSFVSQYPILPFTISYMILLLLYIMIKIIILFYHLFIFCFINPVAFFQFRDHNTHQLIDIKKLIDEIFFIILFEIIYLFNKLLQSITKISKGCHQSLAWIFIFSYSTIFLFFPSYLFM